MEEQWKRIIIDGDMTKYEISSLGNIRNFETNCVLKPSLDSYGYFIHNLYHKGIRYQKKIHRLVAQAFIPNPNNLPQVNHINGIKNDNRVENLEWCTAQQNTQHAHDTGLCTIRLGEKSPNHRYNENDIRKLCGLLETGIYSYEEIYKLTGFNKNICRRILCGVNWLDISKDYDFTKILQLPRHHKQKNHIIIHNSVDRAILHGIKRKKIIDILIDYGLTKNEARGLYDNRKKKIKNNKSLVQNTVYIDGGIEIF